MTSEVNYDTVTITTSRLLLRPGRHPAILLVGHRHADEPYAVALEITVERIQLLRVQLDKAEQFLTTRTGSE